MTVLKPAFVVVLVMLLAACARDVSLSATFAAPAGLAAGSPVYLGDAGVGEVARLTTAGGTTRVEITVDPGLTGALRQGSAALITNRGGRTVLELYNYRPADEPLENGDTLVGLNNKLELAAWQTGEALDTGRRTVDELSRSIEDYFKSDQWRRQKDRMNRQMESLEEELGRSYDETRQAYQEFMQDLENESDVARERARESYRALTRQLQDRIARLREEGSEQFVAPLQRLLEDLSRAMGRVPEQESV